jgi:hypothetical protein
VNSTIVGIIIGALASALANWFFNTRSKRDDRRRDAWTAWAEQAYRLILVRRQLIERCWVDASSSSRHDALGFLPKVSIALAQDIRQDTQLHIALARVLLAEPSASRRKQARAFTDLLSDDIEPEETTEPEMQARRHVQYVEALQATIDDLLGRYADGTTTQVSDWFSRKFEQLTSKDEKQLPYVDDESEKRP